MSQLRFSFLGQFQVILDGQVVRRFESDNARALLAYLALEAGQAHRRSHLAALLWPDHPEAAARNNLRQTLFNLRKTLHDDRSPTPFLLISHQTVQFNRATDYTLDVDMLVAELQALESGTNPDNSARWLSHYTAPLLAEAALVTGVTFDEWLLLRREQLHRRVMMALARLSDLALTQQQWDKVALLTMQQLALDPWREEAYRQLMHALAAQGQRAEALAQFEQCRTVIWDALGVGPMPETVVLMEQIKVGMPAAATLPTLLPPAPPPCHNLPADITPFIGRQSSLNDAAAHLADPTCRLLTLTGLGGIGKTRLALQLARQEQAQYPDGVWWVPLVGLPADSQADHLDGAILAALPLPPAEGVSPTQQIKQFLRGRDLLLILDNFEHLSHTAPHLIELMETAAGFQCLITSRQPLGVPGEWVLPVPPLAYPAPGIPPAQAEQSEAVRLFFQQARMTCPDFPLSVVDEPAVVQICRLVGGHPLALELAASWVDVLSCGEIAQEISRGVGFLRDETGHRPHRQASVEQILAQTWARLSQDDAAALSRLAVFRGGFTRQAAQIVAGITLAQLKTVNRKALLYRVAHQRYDLHELVRQYALHQTEASQAEVQRYHAAYFANFLAERKPEVMTARFFNILPEIEQELDNIAAAWQWAIQVHDLTFFEQATEPVVAVMHQCGRFAETIHWLKAALEICPPDAQVRAHLQNRLNHLWSGSGVSPHEQMALGQSAYATAMSHHDITEAVYAYRHQSTALYCQGDFAGAWAKLKEGLHLAEQGAAAWIRATLANRLCLNAPHVARLAEGKQYGLLGLQLSRELGNPATIWQAEYGLAVLNWHEGKMELAGQHAAASLEILGTQGFPRHRAISKQMQGYVLYRQQRWDEALTLFAAAGESARATGDVDLLTSMLSVAGHIATKQERWDDAVRYTRESVALARQIQNRLQLGITLFPLGLALQQTGMGREAAAALAEGIQIMDELREPYLFFAGLSILLEWLVLTGHNDLTGPIVAYLHQHLTLPPDQRAELESLCQKLNLGPSPAAPDWDTVHVALTSL